MTHHSYRQYCQYSGRFSGGGWANKLKKIIFINPDRLLRLQKINFVSLFDRSDSGFFPFLQCLSKCCISASRAHFLFVEAGSLQWVIRLLNIARHWVISFVCRLLSSSLGLSDRLKLTNMKESTVMRDLSSLMRTRRGEGLGPLPLSQSVTRVGKVKGGDHFSCTSTTIPVPSSSHSAENSALPSYIVLWNT